jgi:hypothetical protein
MPTIPRSNFRARILTALLATAAALAALTPAASAKAAASPAFILVPREGTGLGTVSAYGGVTTAFSADSAGIDCIDIPDTGKTEVNLVWTFWSHRQPHTDSWPAGQRARSTFSLRSETATTLTLRVGLRVAGEWTEMIPAPEISLSAGKPARVSLPLPDALPVGAVEVIRVQITSRSSIPALRVTDWSVREQK